MSIIAPLQPAGSAGDGVRMLALVDELTELAAVDGRRFVAEARALLALRAAAEAQDESMGWPVWVAEAALAQGLSEGSLRFRADRAARLLAHPSLCQALDEARVGVPHALRLLDTLTDAPVTIAERAIQEALGAAAGRTLSPAELAARARRVWYRLDADAIARRRQHGLADRRIGFDHLDRPGISTFGGSAAVEDALAAERRLHTAAKTPDGDDDTRTCAQREADLAMALLTHGQLPDRELPGASTQLAIHIPAATLTGDSDEPGVLTGAGLIDAHHARELGRRSDLVPVVADPVTGAVQSRHEERTDRAPDAARARTPEQVAAAVRRLVELFRRPGAATTGSHGTGEVTGERPGDGDGVWNRDGGRDGVTVGDGVGLHTTEPQYRPSAGLDRFIRTRFTGCAAPTAHSWRTDIEHPVPWPDGPTSGRVLTLLSRRWHRLKQNGYAYTPNADGSTTWTTPLGRIYTSAPPFTAPVLRHRPRDPGDPGPGPPDWAHLAPRRLEPPSPEEVLRRRDSCRPGDAAVSNAPPLPDDPPF